MGGMKSWFAKVEEKVPAFKMASSRGYSGDNTQSPSQNTEENPEHAGTTVISSAEAPSNSPTDAQEQPNLPTAYTTSGYAGSAISSGPSASSKTTPLVAMDNQEGNQGIPREKQLYPAVSSSGRATVSQGDGIQQYTEQSGVPNLDNSAYVVAQAGLEVAARGEAAVDAREEVLLSIPAAMVHMVDQEGSALLTMGELRVVRIIQEGTGVVALVKVGNDLQWPLGWDEPVFKINSHRYVFTLRVSEDLDEDESPQLSTSRPPNAGEDEFNHVSGSSLSSGVLGGAVENGKEEKMAVMSYGVTLVGDIPLESIQQFDTCLQQYCVFSEPEVVASQGVGATAASSSAAPPFLIQNRKSADVAPSAGSGGETAVLAASKENVDSAAKLTKASAAASGRTDTGRVQEARESGVIVSGELVQDESGVVVPRDPDARQLAEKNAQYWTQVAPNVDDYRGTVARGIATGSGGVIKGIFYVSNKATSHLERMGTFARSKLKPGNPEKPLKIQPAVLKSMRRARKLSKMTAKVADSVLAGVVTTTGIVTGAVLKKTLLNSAVGKVLPGDVVIVSLEAFGKLFDAVELAGKNVLNTTSVVTSGIVTHKYGAQAGELAQHGLATTGHMIHTAWTVSKLRKALTPSKTGALKKTQVAKGALKGLVKGVKS